MQEIIVKYGGDIMSLGFQTEILNETYAILTLPAEEIPNLRNFEQIEYVELPKRISPSLAEAADSACITPVQNKESYGLTGEGVLVAVIDSGIDVHNECFKDRILFIWDQTVDGAPPEGFLHGTEYTAAQMADTPHQDSKGHGTAVAGIAAGSNGVAPRAKILAVKLGERDGYARTTEIMRAVKYVFNKAIELHMPVAVNISYGTNDGPHDGSSLFEGYLNDMADKWKNVIVVAGGNEGAAKHHCHYQLKQDETLSVAFSVGTRLKQLNVSLWKNFADALLYEVVSPGGISTGRFNHSFIPKIIHLDGVLLSLVYTQPTHYNQNNAFSMSLEAGKERGEITQGVWTVNLKGLDIVDGGIDLWLPTTEEVSEKTEFLEPAPETTLTIPGCAEKVITVGGYDSSVNTPAVFSGRGYLRGSGLVKPDIVAPAVNVESCKAGGGTGRFTGTSVAAPFVTGSAALIMQWGIVQGNDPYLYGQRIKAFLRRGAARDGIIQYPNGQWGYGKLCLKTSMDYLYAFNAN